jgi:hypothetical protein
MEPSTTSSSNTGQQEQQQNPVNDPFSASTSAAGAVGAAFPSITSDDNNTMKIDRITALQEAIDGLSLSMFESLRSLRDAVAPESGNLGVSPNHSTAAAKDKDNETQPPMDSEELWHAYRKGDVTVREMMHKGDNNNNTATNSITERKEFMRLYARMEMQKDTDLVIQLANTVLSKSNAIDEQVETCIPGMMDMTRQEQMELIHELVQENNEVQQELQSLYQQVLQRRTKCRNAILSKTSHVLDIAEQDM